MVRIGKKTEQRLNLAAKNSKKSVPILLEIFFVSELRRLKLELRTIHKRLAESKVLHYFDSSSWRRAYRASKAIQAVMGTRCVW